MTARLAVVLSLSGNHACSYHIPGEPAWVTDSWKNVRDRSLFSEKFILYAFCKKQTHAHFGAYAGNGGE
jgi:hypothetical protein